MHNISPLLIFAIYLIGIVLAEYFMLDAPFDLGIPEYQSTKIGYLFVAIILITLFRHLRSTTDQYHIFRIPTPGQLADSMVFAVLITAGGFAAIGLQIFITAQVSIDTATTLWDFTGNEFVVGPKYEYLGKNSGAFSLPLFLVTQAVFLPLAEEMYFRGLILEKYATKLGSTGAVLVTSLLFTLPHPGNLHLSTFVFSIMVCCHFILYRNIWLIFLIHGLSNFLHWLISGYGGVDYIESHHLNQLGELSTWALEIVLGASCIALCGWMLYRKKLRLELQSIHGSKTFHL